MTPLTVNLASLAACFLLIGGYHLYLWIRVRKDPTYTIQSVSNDARTAWVDSIIEEKNGILAVQTLRNSTMTATFLASTAILLIMGTLNLLQSASQQGSLLQALKHGGLLGDDMKNIELLILLATFFWAFFSFSMALRMYNHVGYLINSSSEKCQFHPTTHYVSHLLNRSGSYYSMGMRAYYVSVPLIFSLFNPYYMVAASIALIFTLYHIDRAPDAQPKQNDIRKRRRIDVKIFRLRRNQNSRDKLNSASTPHDDRPYNEPPGHGRQLAR
jgi:uncharacterized membrane protein